MSFLTPACSFTEASQIPTADRVRMGIASEEMWSSQRARQPASILAIGTAVPEDCFYQEDFPDYYFRVTGSEHMTELKKKFVRICERSMIKKRHMILTEDFLKENPICSYDAPSLNVRQDTLREYIPKLAAKAASKAIEEWGQPKSKITHVVICSTVPAEMPGVDVRLIKHLGLNTSVKRVMLYNQGCFAGGTALRIAKDLAENNANARVLAVCAESILGLFRGPSENDLGSLVGQAIFSDGACSVIIGADPIKQVERPIFQIMFTSETIIPDSGDSVSAQLREVGLIFNLSNRIPNLIADNIEKSLAEAFGPVGITDWNSIFWIPHPGGPKILDQIEEKLQLDKERFSATRYVLQEYGNMSSVCVLFILDEVRRRSKKERMATTGEGLEWGVLCSFGPGLTVETVVLRSCPTV